MANQTVYPFGTGGSLPSSIGIINDLKTGGADKALSAQQGVVLREKIEGLIGEEQQYSLTWQTGNIDASTDAIVPQYHNKYVNYIALESTTITVTNPSGYYINVFYYDSSKTRLGKVTIGNTTTTYTGTFPGASYIRLCAWDQPSDADVAGIVVSYFPDITLMELRDAIGMGNYSNPVLSASYPDPCIIDGENGYFYMFATGTIGTTKMYRSPNLIDWEEADSPFTDNAVADCLSDLNLSSAFVYWAPEIVKVGNKYNLYISKQANPMLVFQSDHPYFGYEYVGKIITATNGLTSDNIDACVRYDLDGVLWMVWGSTYGMYRQKLATDGLSLDTSDTKAHIAGKTISEDNTRATVFEGAYLYRRKGYWYLFVSAGKYNNYTYCLKVGRSETLTGTFVDKDGNNMTDGYATTILSSANGDTLYGPGHNGRIFTDKDNRTYMIFHSHYTGAGSTSVRYICLQEIFWDENGWPYFGNNGKPQVSGNEVPNL